MFYDEDFTVLGSSAWARGRVTAANV